MKNFLALTLMFFLCLQLVLNADNETKNLKKSSKSLRNSIQKSKNSGDNKKAIHVNSLGHEVEAPMIVDKSPYKLERCDQIVAFDAEFIPDLEDFVKRKKAYFTLTAYHLNRFEKKDVNKLEQSILLSSSRTKPNEPLGARGCLLIDGGELEKPLLLCGKDDKEKEIFENLLETFEDCRAGKMIGKGSVSFNAANEKPSSPGIQDIKKSCGFDGPIASPDAILGAIDQTKQEEKVQGDGEFWVPGGHKVPGSPVEDNTKK